jgi:DNA-binding response OmpR family regulator
MISTLGRQGETSQRGGEARSIGSCGFVAESGVETSALEDALERLGVVIVPAEPSLVGDDLWRGIAPRLLLARGTRAVTALAGWMTFIHTAPQTVTMALLDVSRSETIASLELFDGWLPLSTNPAVIAQAVAAQLRLLDRSARLSSPRIVRGYNLVVDLGREETADGNCDRIPLTPSEFRLLSALAVQPGRTLDFGQLGLALPGRFRDADDAYNSVKVHIGRLRAKLAKATGWDGHLVSVRGRGFLFERRHPDMRRESAPEQTHAAS